MTIQPTPSPTPSRPSRRNAVVGVGAGLLAGGAIGLMAVAPSFTNAASDDASDDGSIVVAQDAAPGDRLREVLQDLVDDGTITAEQADAVAAHLIDHRPERDHRGRHGRLGGPAFDGEVVAELLGIDADTLRRELRAGSSVADIAEANGVEVQAVIDALVDEAAGHLELAVEDGRLTEDEAAEKLADVTARITARIDPDEQTGEGADPTSDEGP